VIVCDVAILKGAFALYLKHCTCAARIWACATLRAASCLLLLHLPHLAHSPACSPAYLPLPFRST